jgi:methylmalonyl-CoA epimerase
LLKVTGLNHIGIAVLDLDDAANTFSSKFGLAISDRIQSKDQDILVALVELENTIVELMQPTDKESTVAKFLSKQGRNSLHHIAFSINMDLERAATELKSIGIEMIYPVPKIGVMGHPINFCHPKFTSNILVELCEDGSFKK